MTFDDTTWCPECGGPLTETRTEDADPESDDPPLVCWGYLCPACAWEAPGEEERLTIATAPWSRPAVAMVTAATKTATRTERARTLALLEARCDAERGTMQTATGDAQLRHAHAILAMKVAHRRIWEGLHLVPATLPDDRADELRLVLEALRRAVESETRKEKQAIQNKRKYRYRDYSKEAYYENAARTYEYTADILDSIHDELAAGRHRRDPK